MSAPTKRWKARIFVGVQMLAAAAHLSAQGVETALSRSPAMGQDPGSLVALGIGVLVLVAIFFVVWKLAVFFVRKLAAFIFRRHPKKEDRSKRTPPPQPISKSIFVSYRREDNPHITGRIYDRLVTRFGGNAVFKDVDSIPIGVDFREHLRKQLGRCAVLVAVIGKNWNPPAASGDRRLNDPRDHLRIEIESALERHTPVIPVLVDGIEMPAEDDLPPSLGSLAYHNGIAVRPDPDFHHDADRLVRGIELHFEQTRR